MGNSGTALGIIGLILAAGAIGFAFIIWNGQNDLKSEVDKMGTNLLVGLWNDLEQNTDYSPYITDQYWHYEFGGNNVSNPDYISTSNSGTRITLMQPGWYKIHLCMLLIGLDDYSRYWVLLLKDGVLHLYLDRYDTYDIIKPTFHSINAYAFVYSNGANYIELAEESDDDCAVTPEQRFNQFSIEYIVLSE